MIILLLIVLLLYFNNDFACAGSNSDQASTNDHFQIKFKLQGSKTYYFDFW